MLTDGSVAAKPDWKQLLTFLRGSRYKQILPWAHREDGTLLLVQSDWKHQITIVGDQSVDLCLTLSSKHYVDTYKDRNVNIYQHYKETFLLNG